MNRKAMSYKPPVPQPIRPKSKAEPKQPKPRPQWVEDFNDTSAKYRVSQMELIKRKAERQSSNRQAAKEELAERMRKLQKGIVDEDTRKVYEEALISKGIDINPSIRRNLSQMIQYEKELQVQSREIKEDEDIEDQVTKQLKNTQEFIKRMEKASKARDITHAIQILEVPTYQKGPHNRTQTMLNVKEELTPLSNIQGTMNFLQNLLKPREAEMTESTLQLPNFSQNIHQSLEMFSKEIVGGVYHTERLQEDLNSVSFVERKNQTPTPNREILEGEEDDWSNTIHRMHNMLETKSKQLQRGYERTLTDDPISMSKQYYKYSESKEEYPCVFNSSKSLKEQIMSLSKTKNIETSNFKQNTDRSNLPYSPRSKGGEEIEFSLTMNNSELKIDTDRFFEDPPHEEEDEYTKSYLNLENNKMFAKKTKLSYLVQEEEPVQEQSFKLVMPSKKVTFSNQVMSKVIGDQFQGMPKKSVAIVQPKITAKNNKQAEIRKLLEQAQNGVGKIVPQRYDITSSVNIKKQLR